MFLRSGPDGQPVSRTRDGGETFDVLSRATLAFGSTTGNLYGVSNYQPPVDAVTFVP